MSSLSVMDVSALVYTGTSSQFFKERQSYGFPVGGIHYLMRQICVTFGKMGSVVLCFDSPTFRAKLNADYKSGRMSSPAVYSQIETIYEGLQQCGVRCVKCDGFEGDDIIDWVVQRYSGDYSETEIVGNDYDLCHSVKPGVRFKSISPNVGPIHVGNFVKSIEPGKTVPFNTISAKKAFCGCKSDKIPQMLLENGMHGEELYQKFLVWLQGVPNGNTYSVTTNWKMPLFFAAKSGLFTEQDFQKLQTNVKLVYPAECPGDVELLPSTRMDLNKEKLAKFLSLYNDFDSLRFFGLRKIDLTDQDKEMLRGKARKLSSGEFAADKNLQQRPKVATKSLDLDCFTKEF